MDRKRVIQLVKCAVLQTAAARQMIASNTNNATMDGVGVRMVLIREGVRVVAHACHMNNTAMEDVSAGMDLIEGNVVDFNAL